jgi:hypothetical protein
VVKGLGPIIGSNRYIRTGPYKSEGLGRIIRFNGLYEFFTERKGAISNSHRSFPRMLATS